MKWIVGVQTRTRVDQFFLAPCDRNPIHSEAASEQKLTNSVKLVKTRWKILLIGAPIFDRSIMYKFNIWKYVNEFNNELQRPDF